MQNTAKPIESTTDALIAFVLQVVSAKRDGLIAPENAKIFIEGMVPEICRHSNANIFEVIDATSALLCEVRVSEFKLIF